MKYGFPFAWCSGRGEFSLHIDIMASLRRSTTPLPPILIHLSWNKSGNRDQHTSGGSVQQAAEKDPDGAFYSPSVKQLCFVLMTRKTGKPHCTPQSMRSIPFSQECERAQTGPDA